MMEIPTNPKIMTEILLEPKKLIVIPLKLKK